MILISLSFLQSSLTKLPQKSTSIRHYAHYISVLVHILNICLLIEYPQIGEYPSPIKVLELNIVGIVYKSASKQEQVQSDSLEKRLLLCFFRQLHFPEFLRQGAHGKAVKRNRNKRQQSQHEVYFEARQVVEGAEGWDLGVQIPDQLHMLLFERAEDCGLLPIVFLNQRHSFPECFLTMLVLYLNMNYLLFRNLLKNLVQCIKCLLISGLLLIIHALIMREANCHLLLELRQVLQIGLEDFLPRLYFVTHFANPLKSVIMANNNVSVFGDPDITLDDVYQVVHTKLEALQRVLWRIQ